MAAKIKNYTKSEINALIEKAKAVPGDDAIDIAFKAVDGKLLTEEERILVAFYAYCMINQKYSDDLRSVKTEHTSTWTLFAMVFSTIVGFIASMLFMPSIVAEGASAEMRLVTGLIITFLIAGGIGTPLGIAASRVDRKNQSKIPDAMAKKGWSKTYTERQEKKND